MFGRLKCSTLASAPFTIEIMEIKLMADVKMGINLLMHPSAIAYPSSGTTANRPAPYKVGQPYLDTTLGKQLPVSK
jgi:hypothetical protein